MVKCHKLAAGVILLAFSAAAASAYEWPLSPESVREAYFLGRRNDDKTREFLARCVKRLPLPKSGPHVSEIEIGTPYKQVVLRARQALNYSAQQAEQEYRQRPPVFLVRVQINVTPTYRPNLLVARPDEFWRGFQTRLVQKEAIAPKGISGRLLYSYPSYGQSAWVRGAEMFVEFDVTQISSAPVRIEVLTPDGQTAQAEFDLRDLR